ncbi:MAG TPA: hypothetical protein VLX92_22065 [Kofleriaceae bacterium]|nr:hypothetical protein [Kofleriaceae bacterium]
MARSFRFQPRYRGIALTAIGVGGGLGVVAVATLGAALLPLATGAVGVVLGAGYLLSPSWKLAVVVDDDGLEVRGPRRPRFRIAWGDVVRVIAAPSSQTCFVDGGAPERSLLVPGVGAPAPYDLEDKRALYDAILAHVDPAKVERVASLEAARKAKA